MGLPTANKKFVFGEESSNGTLVLFPQAFASHQPDWPNKTHQIGFPLFDQEDSSVISSKVQEFLRAGAPPIVFTLGSTIVKMASNFYEMAYLAVKEIGCRAIFLVGKKPTRVPEEAFYDSQICISAYEPFSVLFPKCSVVVHQCGIGTTGQALAAAKPQVLIPYSHDQPDNARRVKKHGIGLTIAPQYLNKIKLIKALKKVTFDSSYSKQAIKLANELEREGFNQRLIRAINAYL